MDKEDIAYSNSLVGQWVMSYDPGFKLIRYVSKEHGPYFCYGLDKNNNILLDKYPYNPCQAVLRKGNFKKNMFYVFDYQSISRIVGDFILGYSVNNETGNLIISISKNTYKK